MFSFANVQTLVYYAVLDKHCISFVLYAPYWIINQTRLRFDYKVNSMSNRLLNWLLLRLSFSLRASRTR